jgi:hypothetical protein
LTGSACFRPNGLTVGQIPPDRSRQNMWKVTGSGGATSGSARQKSSAFRQS